MKRIVLTFLILFSFLFVNAQEYAPQMNFVKFNLSSVVFKNFTFQYERVLSKRFSAALSFGIIPRTTIPYAQFTLDFANGEQEIVKLLEDVRFNYYAITPEVRLYLGRKGYGRGFYIAPYYRYTSIGVKEARLNFDEEGDHPFHLDINGGIGGHSGGIMLGSQWGLGKYVTLDWWIMGLAFGVSNIRADGVPSQSIPQEALADMREGLTDLFSEIPIAKVKTLEVNQNHMKLEVTGPWAGLRGGLVLGVKF
ncbi:MAG: hypothetical protein RBR62_01220 [Bacteroidales bacterium]|jgi:hypothetical protein|nr:hypothetical protein [Bacteroidales bacterium]HHV40257.1 hypothetical protein [Bacteroidales bacterium]